MKKGKIAGYGPHKVILKKISAISGVPVVNQKTNPIVMKAIAPCSCLKNN